MRIRSGYSRVVFLIGNFAIKVANFNSFHQFKCGLSSNKSESIKYKADSTHLCPIVYNGPAGLFNIMRRAEPIEEWEMPDSLRDKVGIDFKKSSFGKIDGRIVAVDYHGYC